MFSLSSSYSPHGNVIRPTTVVEAPRLVSHLGVNVVICTETFQTTGSFKIRAAYSVATNIAQPMVIAASSGNFGQAMAYACAVVGKLCTVVMPTTSAQVKVDAVRAFGGKVEFVDVSRMSRQDRVNELAADHPQAYVANAYDDPLVIEGNSSLGREIAALTYQFDDIVVPIGGGGISSGIFVGLRESNNKSSVIGAEPASANDAARSLAAGELLCSRSESQTIADGARTASLGRLNWNILRTGLKSIVEVPEEKIKEATRLLFHLANLKVEPTGALSVAAVLTNPDYFRGRRVCCVVTGGNVDADTYIRILSS